MTIKQAVCWNWDYANQFSLSELKLSVFTNACKIEIYGCSAAEGCDNFLQRIFQTFVSGRQIEVWLLVINPKQTQILMEVKQLMLNRIIGMAQESFTIMVSQKR